MFTPGRKYFIEEYLSKTSDIFEQASIKVTYNYICFTLLVELLFFPFLFKFSFLYHVVINAVSIIMVSYVLFSIKNTNVQKTAKLLLLALSLTWFAIFIVQEYKVDLFGISLMMTNILFSFFTLGKKYGSAMIGFSAFCLCVFFINKGLDEALIVFHIPPDQIIEQNLAVALAPFSMSCYLVYDFITAKHSAENEIKRQKNLLQSRNSDITDSFIYAKTIQDSILPSKELKQKLFPHSFVLFKPKDIVSGDFYWFAEKNGKKIIAACDCTGHGVPGALMSMIGNNTLNQIVNERGITSPGEILNLLNKEIRKMLKQEENNDTKDGMDIGLISFTSDTEIEFAGANRPLWIISGNSLKEIKGNRYGIGGFQYEKERTFTNHTISLNKNDAVYIFSDGYADQFSGKNEKLMTRKFKQILIDICQKPMPEQEKYLYNHNNVWRGKREQVDDILVIGIKIE